MRLLSLVLTLSLLLALPVPVLMGQISGESVEENADGRFTIGYEEQTLLFGYPHRYSSSHFILKVGSRQASNSEGLYKIDHLKGRRETKVKIIGLETEKGSRHSSTTFNFAGVELKQHLIPVDADLTPVPLGEFGQYYRIEYEVTNKSTQPLSIGLNLILDAMVNGKDNCIAMADGQLVMLDEIFSSLSIPEKVVFHRDHTDPLAPKAVLLVNGNPENPVNSLCVGQWAHLSNLFNLQTSEAVSQFTDDSAVMLEWKSIDLAPMQTRRYVVYYGSPDAVPVNLQYHSPKKVEKLEVFFPPNDSNLTPEANAQIENFVKNTYIKAALLEGYADASGSEIINQQLADDRIGSVSFKLQMLGVKFERILEKSHGEFFANESLRNEQKARKVIITVWR